MHLPHRHTTPIGKINVTPLIDVVMCLIIFYLLVFRLAADRSAKVDLLITGTGIRQDLPRAIIITITDSPRRILIDGIEVRPDALPAVLAARIPADPAGRPPVQLRADRHLPYSAISPIIDACRAAGLPSIELVTEREA